MRHGWILIQTDSYGGTACRITEESEVGVCKYDNTKKKLTVICAAIFVFWGMWMMLTVHCRAAETNHDETQTNEQKIIRVGSFEDTFDYVDKNGVRRGYGYELMQALAGYTGWKFEYVKCDWSNCFDKLENGEIDIMGDISYTDERAQKMLFQMNRWARKNTCFMLICPIGIAGHLISSLWMENV